MGNEGPMEPAAQETAPQPGLYDQLEALPEHLRGEIVGGRLYVHPRPAPRHLHATAALDRTIGRAYGDADGYPGGWRIYLEPEIHFLRKVEVDVPDLAGWRRERMPTLPTTAFFETVPDWVCEVLSPGTGTYDRTIKMPIYARFGVAHAWLVDPDARTLEAFALEAGGWAPFGVFRGTRTVSLPPFVETPLDLGRLWA